MSPPRPPRACPTSTCARRWVVAPLIAIIIALGFFPKPLLDVINPAVDRTMQQVGRHRPEPVVPAGTLSEGSGE